MPRPTATPGYDAEAIPQTDADFWCGARKTARTACPARVYPGAAVAATTTTAAATTASTTAALEQREPFECNDPELIQARPHHPPGAEGHQGAGRGVLHVRIPVDAVLRTQPAAFRVPRLRGQHQQRPHRPGYVAGLRQFHG